MTYMIKHHINVMTKVYLTFYKAVLRVFTTFNKLLQLEASLIHYLHWEQNIFLFQLCSKYIQSRNIQELKTREESFLSLDNYLCDLVVKDIKIAVYLESPRKINFNLMSDYFSK